jgi:predicted transcriptional regulator
MARLPVPGTVAAPARVRDQVLAFVGRYPGVHVRAIERELHLSSRLAAYHLGQLEAEGRVQCVHETGFSRYFLSLGAPRWSKADVQFLGLMRRPVALRIVLLLAGQGPLDRIELGQRLDLARASVSHHLGQLADAGLIASEPRGRRLVYRLAEPEQTLGRLANFTPLPDDLEPFDAMWHDLVG